MIRFMLDMEIRDLPEKLDYRDGIMMMGSCFTEHIGESLQELKFNVLQNPHGILFDPWSVCSSLVSYIDNKQYGADDLFLLNELWQSWAHHGRYSGTGQQDVLDAINQSQRQAHEFLKEARWLVITLGTSFSYRLKENGKPVANCHRAPAAWFNKQMMTIDDTVTALDECIYRLFQFNPKIEVLFTVSPVRNIRDGAVENNRSKARLLEAVHHLCGKFSRLHYFPAYELVIDVLRDYRFYDIDLVHPNYQATKFVIDHFMQHCINESSVSLSKEIEKINIARKHRAFQPSTEAHHKFLQLHAARTRTLMQQNPYLDLREELGYFEQSQ